MPSDLPQQRSQDRRALLERAAVQTALQGGLSELSLQRVATRARLAKSVVLYYFGDRCGLLEALAMASTQPIVAAHEPLATVGVDPRGQLNAWLSALFALSAPPSLWLLHAMLWTDTSEPRVRVLLDGGESTAHEALAGLLQRGHDQYCWHAPDPHLAATVLRALVDGVLLRSARLQDPSARERLHAQCRGAVLDLLVLR